jgi:hypothetical protein
MLAIATRPRLSGVAALTFGLVLCLSSCSGGGEDAGAAIDSDQPRLFVEVIPREEAGRVDVQVDGEPFTSYIWPASAKKPTLFPIVSASGVPVTRGYPLDPRPGERTDHPHQIGLWLNYGQVNGIDFWGNSDARDPADAPRLGTVEHREVRSTRSGSGKGSLEATAEWVDRGGRVLLREETRYVFRAEAGLRAIDRITTLTALDEPVTFADTKEGMLGLRVARSLEQPSTQPVVLTEQDGSTTTVPVADNTGVTGLYRSSEGLRGDSVWGTRARWVALDGEVEGEAVTVAILDHPSNPGYPTYWHARGYGLFAANPLGQKDFSEGREELNLRLQPGESTTMRYRIVILSGGETTERIEAEYQGFSDEG